MSFKIKAILEVDFGLFIHCCTLLLESSDQASSLVVRLHKLLLKPHYFNRIAANFELRRDVGSCNSRSKSRIPFIFLALVQFLLFGEIISVALLLGLINDFFRTFFLLG